jgi:dienelactone hydrolase
MTDSGVDCQMLLFSGVNHSFTDRHAEASSVPGLKYDARADRRAWAAMQNLFAEAFAQ